MPDGVDPFRSRFVRHGFGIDSIGCEAFLENGIREAEIGTDAVVEGVVGVCDVFVPPAELPCVEGEDAS